ncbi:lysine-specific demethylase JMJ30 isoform X4 [Momordica charantia]|uniref:Lysine-specific demethylase JMJ30 isoform X4 n=1 Tax=Momordica charantia TaxID=3673 RepID=A0A6J1DKM6_MOMCH|nr:lysine-specific demethylase JMJ30 isoform X4 [Momordica charantia]
MSSSEPNGAPSSFHFETPLLDAQSPSLLHSISEHGGYAFVAMASLAAAGDSCAAEAAAEMAWEQLHSGPWHSVLPIWRDAYSMACLYMASFHFAAREFKEALRVLDMGLIMGGALLRKDLDSAIEKVSAEARIVRVLDVAQSDDQSERPLLYDERSKEVRFLGICQERLSLIRWSQRCLLCLWRDSCVNISNQVSQLLLVMVWLIGQLGQSGRAWITYKRLPVTVQSQLRIQSTDCSDDITYLAQHPLFDQINELRNDICIPDYCFVGGGELRSLNAWFGPAGTVTPLHHDPHHNILAQVLGKKYIRLYDASLSEELYPYTETMLCNSSQVDLDSIDGKEFPKAVDLEFVDCILEEGEMLYIPPKWWHYVRSLTTSFSVSFWWNNCENSTTS